MQTEMIVFIIIALVIVVLAIISLRSNTKNKQMDKAYFHEQWRQVQQLQKDGRNGWRLAIIDADKLTGIALRQRGIKGQNMSDRLRAARPKLSHYNELWAAHRLRNRLVHEPNFALSKEDATGALKAFHRALQELGVLS